MIEIEPGSFAWEPESAAKPKTKVAAAPIVEDQQQEDYFRQPEQQYSEPDQSETGLGYLFRNLVAKAPTYAYDFARTGGGIPGELADLILRNAPANEPSKRWTDKKDIYAPIYKELEQQREGMRAAFGGGGRAREELSTMASKVLPEKAAKYLTESKEGDWFGELLGRNAALGATSALTGGIKSVSDAANFAKTMAGVEAGGAAGKEILGAAGEQLAGPTGKDVGEFVGSWGGGKLGGAVASKPPTKTIGALEDRKLQKSFEQGKQERIKYHENERIKNGETPVAELAALDAEYANRLDPKIYQNKIELQKKLANENALKHEKLEKNTFIDGTKIKETAKEVQNDVTSGVSEGDIKTITKFIDQIIGNTKGGQKLSGGKMPLHNAKLFIKRINNILYDKNASPTLKQEIGRFKKPLIDLINESGSPEHNEAYKAYTEAVHNEQGTGYKDLERNKKSVEAQIKANTKKYDQQRKVILNKYKDTHAAAIESIGKENWQDFKADKQRRDKAAANMEKVQSSGKLIDIAEDLAATGFGVYFYGLKGLAGGILSKMARSTLKYASKKGLAAIKEGMRLYNDHPELLKEYGSILIDASQKPEILINRLNDLGKKAQGYMAEENEKPQSMPKNNSFSVEPGAFTF